MQQSTFQYYPLIYTCLPNVLFPVSDYETKMLYDFLIYTMRTTYTAHLVLLEYIIQQYARLIIASLFCNSNEPPIREGVMFWKVLQFWAQNFVSCPSRQQTLCDYSQACLFLISGHANVEFVDRVLAGKILFTEFISHFLIQKQPELVD